MVGDGLKMKGFLIATQNDFEYFKRIFDRFFLRSCINGVIKEYLFTRGEIDIVNKIPELQKVYFLNLIRGVSTSFQNLEILRLLVFEEVRSAFSRKPVWIVLDSKENDLFKKDLDKFWDGSVEMYHLPKEFNVLKIRDVWEEISELGPIEYKTEMAWQDLAFFDPKVVKYIDEKITKGANIDFLSSCDNFGLI